MENEGGRRRREHPRSEVPQGPRTRSVETEARLAERRRRVAERQRTSRARRDLLAALNDGGETEADPIEGREGSPQRRIHRTTVDRHADRISCTLIQQLLRLDSAELRAAVLQRDFSNVHIQPLLPAYYPRAEDARSERQLLMNIRAELQRTKNPHTSGLLARKRSILEAAVSEIEADFSKFHRILGTNKVNVVGAIDRVHNASTTLSTRLVVPCRRKREGGISDAVKIVVMTWWTAETRVSPNRKDIRRKRLGRSLYDTHPAHLLMETQVLKKLDLPLFGDCNFKCIPCIICYCEHFSSRPWYF